MKTLITPQVFSSWFSLDQSIWASEILLEAFPKWCVHQLNLFPRKAHPYTGRRRTRLGILRKRGEAEPSQDGMGRPVIGQI
jgi:hypothetical protein